MIGLEANINVWTNNINVLLKKNCQPLGCCKSARLHAHGCEVTGHPGGNWRKLAETGGNTPYALVGNCGTWWTLAETGGEAGVAQQSIYTFLHRGARGQHRRYELLLPDELEDELEDEPLPLERPRPLDELLECSLSGWLGWWPARCATSRSELDSGMLAATAPAPRAAGRGRRGCRAGATGARRRAGRCPWLPRSAATAAVWSNSTSVLTSAGSGGAGRDSSWARSTSIGGTPPDGKPLAWLP